jgi:hypothetical protein
MGKNYRRIEQLKAIAFDCGFGNEDAKLFGKLSKTATWEAMLETYGVPFPVDNSSVDTEDTEESDLTYRVLWLGGGGGAPARLALPPRPRPQNFSAAGTGSE